MTAILPVKHHNFPSLGDAILTGSQLLPAADPDSQAWAGPDEDEEGHGRYVPVEEYTEYDNDDHCDDDDWEYQFKKPRKWFYLPSHLSKPS